MCIYIYMYICIDTLYVFPVLIYLHVYVYIYIYIYVWATVNIWYIAPSHQFLKSVLSFFMFWHKANVLVF